MYQLVETDIINDVRINFFSFCIPWIGFFVDILSYRLPPLDTCSTIIMSLSWEFIIFASSPDTSFITNILEPERPFSVSSSFTTYHAFQNMFKQIVLRFKLVIHQFFLGHYHCWLLQGLYFKYSQSSNSTR